MRHTIIALCAPIILFTACSSAPEQRTVTAIIGGGGGRTLYFERFQNNKPAHLDSIVLDASGKGTFHLPTLPLDFYALSLGDRDMLVLILDSTESVTAEATVGNFREPVRVEGSKHTDIMRSYFAESSKFDAEHKALVDRINADRNDVDAINRITTINGEFLDRSRRFVQDHKDSPAVLAAIGRLNAQEDLPLYIEVREGLRRSIPRSEYFAGFRDQVDRMEKQLEAMKAQEAQMAQMDNLIAIGSVAPDFSQPTPDGKSVSLASLKGKVVLIDFWASWCKPCRMENPNVKRVYAKYQKKGFEILGVSLDRDKNAWTKAIADDGLPWKHVSDLGFWNNAAAQQYGVQSIPFTVLVDKEGKVIAKNLRGEALDQKLAEVFQ
ncbi:MAG TPA: TlpA disulfide reductase family protein [Flavobacteriales bacterium]